MAKLSQTNVAGLARREILYDDGWFGQNDQRLIYLRYYSMPFQPKDDFYVPGIERGVIEHSGIPFKVNVAHISDQDYATHVPWLINAEDGHAKVHVERLKRILPSANYVVISTPLDTGAGAYESASIAMDGVVAIMRLIGGNKLLYQMAREAVVDVSTGNMNSFTEEVPFPNEIGEPVVTADTWSQFEEVASAVAIQTEPIRGRVTLAMQLVEQAYHAKGAFKFFSYWVALEVAAGGHQKQRIVSLLAKGYGKSNSYIQNNLGVENIWQTRTAVVHDGERYSIPPDVERYVQCLFMDMFRVVLGLDCNENMASMIKAGFDVLRLDRKIGQANVLTVQLNQDKPPPKTTV